MPSSPGSRYCGKIAVALIRSPRIDADITRRAALRRAPRADGRAVRCFSAMATASIEIEGSPHREPCGEDLLRPCAGCCRGRRRVSERVQCAAYDCSLALAHLQASLPDATAKAFGFRESGRGMGPVRSTGGEGSVPPPRFVLHEPLTSLRFALGAPSSHREGRGEGRGNDLRRPPSLQSRMRRRSGGRVHRSPPAHRPVEPSRPICRCQIDKYVCFPVVKRSLALGRRDAIRVSAPRNLAR